MGHELWTPLNAIIGLSGLLLTGASGELNDAQRQQLEMIRTAGDRLLAIIREILDFPKIEAQRIEVEQSDVDLCQVLRESVELLRPLAERKKLELELECDPHCVVARTDHRRLRQILVKLVGNAVKFTEEGGVTVSLGLEGDAATVAVRDTGPGILAEDKESIFTEFGLGHCARVRDTEGTGLGQPIALRLANLLGGSIALTSAVGEDSVFTLVIPLELHDASALPNRINLSTDAWPEPSGRSLPLALGAMSVRELFPVGYM